MTGKRKPGRPPLDIDPKVIEGMASVGATDKEIAEFCGCSVDTITRRFADILAKARADVRIKLRRAQIKAALKGNATMLIWLGKQMLGQQDRQEVALSGSVSGVLAIPADYDDWDQYAQTQQAALLGQPPTLQS